MKNAHVKLRTSREFPTISIDDAFKINRNFEKRRNDKTVAVSWWVCYAVLDLGLRQPGYCSS
ncbi:hypothetical protein SPIROBIBN47_270035 [uncultured spirochete]|jgi:hypothetical protein|uniref:Uncharacterized protein n=1 Tax=uncultured spirochete TaxID=156406 RepID=A0A3P3XIN8_9SPIR|nr:hypothetical protein SPIROBIBN47_270035 [uncultured spirochete]